MVRLRPTLRPLVLLLAAGALLGQEAPSFSRKINRAELPARKGPNALKGHDRADLRRDWNRYWFGGDATPEYLDAKNALAAREAAKWAHLLPGGKHSPAMAAAAVDPAWVNLGPRANLEDNVYDSDSGRPVSIVTHPTDPKIVYLATSGGGVYKSVNADLAAAGDWTWTPITDSLPASGSTGNVSVGGLAMSPSDPETLFLGLGDAFDAEGRGFYKSTNGGTDWTQATGMGNATRTYKIIPVSASIILVGTNDGLKRSINGGDTFDPVSLGGSITGQVWSVQSFSATELICSREVGSTGTLWYSSDAGATWIQASVSGLTSPGRITLATSAASASTGWGIYENGGTGKIDRGLLSTSDKGHTWIFVAAPTISGGLFQGIGNQMSSDGGQGFYNHCVTVDPTNVNRVFVGSNLALYRTEDGGANWTQLTHWYGNRHVYSHADFHTASWSKTGPSTLYIGNDGGLTIVRKPAIPSGEVPTSTSGSVAKDTTFIDNRRNKGLATHLVYNLGSTNTSTPADSRDRITLGMQDNGTRVRQNMGAGLAASDTFEDMIGGDGFGTVIHPVDGNKMLGSIYYTRIYKSTNGGTSAFTPASSGITESNDENLAPFAPKIALGLADATGDTVFTFTNTKVYKSTDFASSWTAMDMTGFDAARFLRNVNTSKTHPDSVAAVSSAGRVWITHNGGAAWTESNVSGGISFMSYVWFDTASNQTLYAASVAPNQITKSHLWKSANGGTTWTPADVGNGLPFGIPIHVIQNHPTDSNTLYAGTDFGLYRTTDGGANWARYGSGLPMVAVRDLYVAPDGSFLRVGTYGRGVWEIQPSAAATAPTFTTHPLSQTVALGDTVTFTALATGNPSPTYQWKKDGVDISTATNASYTTPGTTSGDNGASFTVVATNSVSSVTSNAAILTVVTPIAPAITTQPTNQTVNWGQSATFSVAATGTPTPTYQWKKGGVDISGATAAIYTTPATVALDSGSSFTVGVSNSAGNVTSTPATLTVILPAPPAITGQPQNSNSGLVGGSATFNVTATGTGPFTYAWTKNSGAVGANSSTLTLSNLVLGDNDAQVAVTVSNAGGSTPSAAATLKVRTRDLSGDTTVDVLDLAYIARVYGTNDTAADLNGDGNVDDADIDILLAGL